MVETDVAIGTLEFLWGDTPGFFNEIHEERAAQLRKWGVQHWPGGTATSHYDKEMADAAKRVTDAAMARGDLTWRDILCEEMLEAFAESEWPKVRGELVQAAAVIAAWVEDGDHEAANREAAEKDHPHYAAGGPVTYPRASAPVPDADQGTEGRDQ
jgi:hypothetical protein